MSDHPSDIQRGASRRRDQKRNKDTPTLAKRQEDNDKQPLASSSRKKDTEQLTSGLDSGGKNHVVPLTHAAANDMPPEQSGKGDAVEDKRKRDVAGEEKPKRDRRRSLTPIRRRPRAAAQPNDPATTQHTTRLPERRKVQQPMTAPRRRRVSPAALDKCSGKIRRTNKKRKQPVRVPNRERNRSASSVESHRGRSPSRVRNEQPRHESRGRSRRRSKSTRDTNRRRTRSRSLSRSMKKLSGKNKRDESGSRVVCRGASILLWEDERRHASVQLRLDCIRAGSYGGKKIIYLRVSVVVTRGKIDIKDLFIYLQLRCPCCDERWTLARYSPMKRLGHGVDVDCKDTGAAKFGGEAGGNVPPAEAKLTAEKMKEKERQYTHKDCYELNVTEADNILKSQLSRVGDTVRTSPPSHFKLQIIAEPPCDSDEMQITADLTLNNSNADGSWRPVPLEELKDLHNYDNWKDEDWKRRDGGDLFETK